MTNLRQPSFLTADTDLPFDCCTGRYMKQHNTIDRLVQNCLQTYAQKRYSPRTITIYEKALNRFTVFLNRTGVRRIQDVDNRHISDYQHYLTDMNYAPASLDIFLRSVRVFFNYLEDHHYVFVNPARHLRTPRYRRKLMPVPSRSDVDSLLDQPDTTTIFGIRNKAILETAYCCGLRLIELSGLSVTDFNPNQVTLQVNGKGNKERVLPLGREALKWLKHYLKNVRPQMIVSENESAFWISQRTCSRLKRIRPTTPAAAI